MPIFEYICQECQHEFEALVFGPRQGHLPQVSKQEAKPAAERLRSLCQRLGRRLVRSYGSLRLLRRPKRSRLLLARRHGLKASSYFPVPRF
jgi:hypothetical protein